MIKIEQAFNPETKSVHDFFVNSSVGFYIPLYQRAYSWDTDNVNQLLDDISKGVENVLKNPIEEIRFLGTIITVTATDKRTIKPQDPQGLPDYIENIIDGQQRISTICLLATELYFAILSIESSFPKNSPLYSEVEEVCDNWKKKLISIISLDLNRGNPKRKPKIIRGSIDTWTRNGELEKHYKSSVSYYLAKAIDNIVKGITTAPELQQSVEPEESPSSVELVSNNIKRFKSWLKGSILRVSNDTDGYPSAVEIIAKINQLDLWSFEREDLVNEILKKDLAENKIVWSKLCSLVQLLAATHYLLDRCCFTIIKPKNDDWAFDLFQSLNATGTPLTAIEVFQPLVVNVTDSNNESYKDSPALESFKQIDNLFKGATTAAQKSQWSNEFLTSFRVVVDGNKLESHFSKQRKWLTSVYEDECKDYEDKKAFISFFGNYAEFYKDVWRDYNGKISISTLPTGNEAEIASLLILLLKESNHKMAIPVLGFFYDQVLKGSNQSVKNFLQAVKAVSAYYILWRSSKDNAGLDNTYRDFFKGKEGQNTPHKWLENREININELKTYFLTILEREDVLDRSKWIEKSTRNLRYDRVKPLSKFALFVSSHDTIIDEELPGLMKKGVHNCNPNYLRVESWIHDDFKTIEHIVPQGKKKDLWAEDLLSDDELLNYIGNLTLLPNKVNISASNKGWKEKLLYYKHLGEKDPLKKTELANKAKTEGILLSEETIKLLQKSNYASHIDPVTHLGEAAVWNRKLIIERSKRMCELVYDFVIPWLR